MLAEACAGPAVFGNIVKYLKITLSANVGNVTSMLAAAWSCPS